MTTINSNINGLTTDLLNKWDDELFKPFTYLTTDKKNSVKGLQADIDRLLTSNKNLTFEEISKAGQFADLQLKLQTQTTFPQTDTFYQALVWHFRNIQKTDTHCHLGMGLSVNQLATLICNLDKSDFNTVLQNLTRQSIKGLRGQLTKIIVFTPSQLLRNKTTIKFLIRLSGVLRNWNSASFYIISKQTLQLAVAGVAKNYLKDNVTTFGIRLNPFKRELFSKETSIETVFKETLETVIAALDEAAEIYNVDKNKLTVTVSLNREHEEIFLDYSKTVFSNWNNLPKEITNRVKGFDLSGAEGKSDNNISINSWTPIIQTLGNRIEFTPHLGDIRNLKRKTSLYDKWTAFINSNEASSSILMDLVQEHYNFIQQYLETMPINSSIAHGISISSKIIFLKPTDPSKPQGERNVFVFDLEKRLENEELETKRETLFVQLSFLKSILKQKNIKICFCPTATVKSLNISDFKSLPIYEWITKDRLNVKIGIDGIYQYPQPKTLSEELAKLFITKPNFSRPLTYQEVISLTT